MRRDIRAKIVECGRTQAGLAREVGVSPSYFASCIDNPDPKWGLKVKRHVARRLGLRVLDLWPTGGSNG